MNLIFRQATQAAWLVPLLWMAAPDLTEAKPYQVYEGPRQADKEVRLTWPEDIRILTVNGETPDTGGLLGSVRIDELRLLPGTHVLSLRYAELWDYDSLDDYEKLRSQPVEVTFQAETAGRYKLNHPRPATMRGAKAYERSFSGDNVSFQRLVSTPKPRTTAPAAPPVTQTSTPAVAPKPTPPTQVTAPAMQAAPAMRAAPAAPLQPAAMQSTVDILQYWWDKSTPEERDSFKRWIQDHP